LLIAKKKNILQRLVNDFKSHKRIKKVYYAIVLGKMLEESGTITKKLEKIENAKNENKVQVSEK
jgi:23S rRNA-/tRNA-specific pseudouridylate synthase